MRKLASFFFGATFVVAACSLTHSFDGFSGELSDSGIGEVSVSDSSLKDDSPVLFDTGVDGGIDTGIYGPNSFCLTKAAVIFCDDFEESTSAPWDSSAPGFGSSAFRIEPFDAAKGPVPYDAGPGALFIDTTENHEAAFFITRAPTETRFDIEFDCFIESLNTRMNILGNAPADGVSLGVQNFGGTLQLQVGKDLTTGWTASFNAWTHVHLQYREGTMILVGLGSTGPVTIDAGALGSTLPFGAVSSGANFRAYFDNFIIYGTK